jgi:hypothetical protein
MPSGIVIATAAASLLGFLLNASVLYIVFSRRSHRYHLLFAAVLFICALWDGGIFLTMVRNSHLEEIPVYGYVVTLPCILLPALIFHFTQAYLGLSYRWVVVLLWVSGIVTVMLSALGILWPIEGVYEYPWGNIFRNASPPIAVVVPLLYNSVTIAVSCRLLLRVRSANPGSLAARHALYIIFGFSAIGLAMLKVFVVYGINVPLFLPLGMILNDIFASVIGLAIVKQRLFDITLILKKSAFYSVLAAIVIFVFSLSEHTLASYIGELIGERSQMPHVVSIAIAIAILLPLYRRMEHALDNFFSKRKFDF